MVVGTMTSGQTYALAAFAKLKWSMVNSPWSLKFPNATANDDGHLLEMTGPHIVRLFLGGRLDYESKRCDKHKSECEHEPHLITAVKFSAEDPYGTAVALLDMKSGTVKVKKEWFVLPGLIVTFILCNLRRKEGRSGMAFGSKEFSNGVAHSPAVGTKTNRAGGCGTMGESGACFGSGCFGSGTIAKSGVCFGSGCFGSGGSCGTMAKSGACFGSGCFGSGGSCGTMVESGACFGSGCFGSGGSCGTMAKSGACFGSGNGGGSGTMSKSSACFGSGCFGSGNPGGYGDMMKGQGVTGKEIIVA